MYICEHIEDACKEVAQGLERPRIPSAARRWLGSKAHKDIFQVLANIFQVFVSIFQVFGQVYKHGFVSSGVGAYRIVHIVSLFDSFAHQLKILE